MGAAQLTAEPPAQTAHVTPSSVTQANARLRRVVEEHLGLVWRVARRAGLGREDAEDASQLAFLVLSQRLEDVPPRAEPAFLISTVLRIAKDLRLRKWNTAVDSGFDADARESPTLSPEDELDRQRASTLLAEELEALQEPERMAFVLVEIEQMSRREAAHVLQIPEGTVASRLVKARSRLEAAFSRAFKDPRGQR